MKTNTILTLITLIAPLFTFGCSTESIHRNEDHNRLLWVQPINEEKVKFLGIPLWDRKDDSGYVDRGGSYPGVCSGNVEVDYYSGQSCGGGEPYITGPITRGGGCYNNSGYYGGGYQNVSPNWRPVQNGSQSAGNGWAHVTTGYTSVGGGWQSVGNRR